MAINSEVGGFSGPKKVEGVTKEIAVSTVRFKSDGQLDVVLTGDGSLTTLQLVKQVGALLTSLTPPDPLPSNWDELVKTPGNGTAVTVSFAVRTQYIE